MSRESEGASAAKKRKGGPRKGGSRKGAAPAAPATRPWWLAGLGAVALLGFTLWAWEPRNAPEPHVVRGNEHYRGRRYGDALGEYEAAPGNGPRFAGVHMDRGLARYRVTVPPPDAGGLPLLFPDAGTPDGFTAAQEELRTAARGGTTGAAEDVDASLRARAAYNLGNTYFTLHQWDPAMESYKEALRLRPGWREAAWNLELARRFKELERNPPDAGNDASADATPPDSGPRDGGPPDSAPPDGGPPDAGGRDGGMDGGQGDSGAGDSGANDSGAGDSGASDSGSSNSGADSGASPDANGGGQDAAAPSGDAAPPRSLGPLDELDRSSRSLQNELLRRRGIAPRSPDDDRKK